MVRLFIPWKLANLAYQGFPPSTSTCRRANLSCDFCLKPFLWSIGKCPDFFLMAPGWGEGGVKSHGDQSPNLYCPETEQNMTVYVHSRKPNYRKLSEEAWSGSQNRHHWRAASFPTPACDSPLHSSLMKSASWSSCANRGLRDYDRILCVAGKRIPD